MSVRGKPKVYNEMGFALMAVNLRKYTAINNENGIFSHENKRKKGCIYLLLINTTFFVYLGLVMSQPLFHKKSNLQNIPFRVTEVYGFSYTTLRVDSINDTHSE